MFTATEFEHINKEFKAKQKARKQNLLRIWAILIVITVFLAVSFVLIFPNQFNSSETSWILPTYGGILFLTTTTGFLITLVYTSERPVFEYLYHECFKKINMFEGLFLEYIPYDKEDTEFNKIGGLFTKYASVKTRRHIKGNTEEHHSFDIYDCTIITSSGKSSTIHFNGVYYILNKQVNTSLQVRTHSSPRHKGIKFEKQDNYDTVRVYKEVGQSVQNIDHQFISFVETLVKSEQYKKVSLSIIDGQIHLALWHKKFPANKQASITLDSLNTVTKYFMSEYEMINAVAAVDIY